jgi:hypothetical protein
MTALLIENFKLILLGLLIGLIIGLSRISDAEPMRALRHRPRRLHKTASARP